MTDFTMLRQIEPSRLGAARTLVHGAVQLISRPARANLVAATDDSHANLAWDGREQRFMSQPLPTPTGDCLVCMGVAPLRLELVVGGGIAETLALAGRSYTDAAAWLDERLINLGLSPAARITLPYELPSDVMALVSFTSEVGLAEPQALAAWYDLASELLASFVADRQALNPSPVRCWPHHFDIATYVQLQGGDTETAKGIGVGMSPGDGSYDQPYLYVSPWPNLPAAELPDAPAPGHWHTRGFVAAVATAGEIRASDELFRRSQEFINQSFDIGRERLGA